MYAFIIAFLVIATIVALGTLLYVVIDVILERTKNEMDEAKPEVVVAPIPMPVPIPEPEPEPIPEPEPEPIPVPIIIPAPAFDHIDAIEADAILTDEIAMDSTRKESGAGHGRGAEINIGTIDQHFEQGEIITIDALKEKKTYRQEGLPYQGTRRRNSYQELYHKGRGILCSGGKDD